MRIFNRFLIAAVVMAAGLSSGLARGDDSISNPKYTAWAKFKPGSSNTIAADVEMRGNQVHVEIKRTLVSVTDEEIVIEVRPVVNVMGHDHQSPVVTQTIKARADKEEIKETGEKDVEAMGKTFKCKVYEASPKPTEGKPASREVPGANLEGKKATVYASTDVPGGIVKLETVGTDGKTPINFILTAMESK